MKSDLAAFLRGNATITAITGDRIYPMLLPQDSDLPAITYERDNVSRQLTFDGENGVRESFFDVRCHAASYKGADELAAAVKTELRDFIGTMSATTIKQTFLQNETDSLDIEPGVFSVWLTYSFWHED